MFGTLASHPDRPRLVICVAMFLAASVLLLGCSKKNVVDIGTCSADSECPDDGKPCTKEVCEQGSCTSRNLDGVSVGEGMCHNGDLCAGCYDGKNCQKGDVVGQCGKGGAACQDCDDKNACTTDHSCDNGVCRKATAVADGTLCPGGGGVCYAGQCCLGCWDGTGCRAGTADPSACGKGGTQCKSCDDGNPCTEDTCTAAGCDSTKAVNEGQACGSGNGGLCRKGACCMGCWDDANSTCHANPDKSFCGKQGGACSSCVDTNECTDDVCTNGTCDHPAKVGTCAGGVCVGTDCQCGGTGQPCCTTGTACKNSNEACGAGLTCGACGADTQPCCTSGSPCAGNNTVCDTSSSPSTCRACGTLGKLCCAGSTCGTQLSCDGTGKCVACGDTSEPCCTSGNQCVTWFNCDTGTCAHCGSTDEACCTSGAQCNSASLVCLTAHCKACGTVNLPCCAADQCGTKLLCNTTMTPHTCLACGGASQPCCGTVPACDAGLACAGQTCTGCVTSAAIGSGFVCALRTDGKVFCSGKNDVKQLGTDTPPATVALAPGGNVVMVTAGERHGCALKDTGAVYCWGDGSSTPATISFPVGGKVVEIDAGGTNTCVRRDDGSVLCWTLGNSPTSVTMPVGKAPSQIAVGENHTCIAMTDGTLFCRGFNNRGQLGTGDTTNSLVNLVQVKSAAATFFDTAIGVDVGASHTCVVKTDNTVWCWGDNNQGQLGQGNTNAAIHYYPEQVSAMASVASVALGSDHSCARKSNGEIWCWGSNVVGQVGSASPTAGVPTQVQVMATSSAAVGGYVASCAVRGADHTLWCWGKVYNTSSSTPTVTPIDCP